MSKWRADFDFGFHMFSDALFVDCIIEFGEMLRP